MGIGGFGIFGFWNGRLEQWESGPSTDEQLHCSAAIEGVVIVAWFVDPPRCNPSLPRVTSLQNKRYSRRRGSFRTPVKEHVSFNPICGKEKCQVSTSPARCQKKLRFRRHCYIRGRRSSSTSIFAKRRANCCRVHRAHRHWYFDFQDDRK